MRTRRRPDDDGEVAVHEIRQPHISYDTGPGSVDNVAEVILTVRVKLRALALANLRNRA